MPCDTFFCFLVISGTVQIAFGYNREDFIPERNCAAYFSNPNFEGDSFQLKDFDQSANLKRDYRSSLAGWLNTSSIKIEAGCKVVLCDDAYFTGSCHLVNSNFSTMSNTISKVHSANCSCSRECKCEHVYIGKDEFGRAYLGEGCNTCDSEYISLMYEASIEFPIEERDAVTAFIIRSGCNLTVYSGEHQNGEATVVTSSVFQEFRGTVSSYQFSCDDAKFISRQSSQKRELPFGMMVLPESDKELYRLLTDNHTLSNHPGLEAALTSAENGRSARNAYLVYIGDPHTSLYGFHQCPNLATDKIGECSIPVDMDHFGLSETRLWIITVPIGHDSAENDKMVATLHDYLITHEQLKEAVPNAVIIQNDIRDNDFTVEESSFQQKLQALHILRHRLVDEKYSNIVFLLNYLNRLSLSEQRDPETRIAALENATFEKWTFPSPTVMVPVSFVHTTRKYVNGYRKLENEEYWPRNLATNLENLCEKAGDPLGGAIFSAYFKNKNVAGESVKTKVYNAPGVNQDKVIQYQQRRSTALSQKQIWKTLHSSMTLEVEDGGDDIPVRNCATLFSTANFEEDSFDLMDFDQSVNLRKDYRSSVSGWLNTGSVKIADGCKMTACNDTNFLGTCQSLNSDVALLNQLPPSIRSANCTCPNQECKCENVILGKHEFGRAYLKGGCGTCHTEYIRLWEAGNFPMAEKDSVEAFVLREGCNFTTYAEDFLQGAITFVTGDRSVIQDFSSSIGSYKFSCDNTQSISRQSVQKESKHLMIELPATPEELLELTSKPDGGLSNHPGLRAALKSGENERSFSGAYVIVIGTHRPKHTGFAQCSDASELLIGECRIQLSLSDLGIENTALRIITLPIAVHSESKIENDHRLMASLDSYMSSNDNLQNVAPNAVIVYHRAPFKHFATFDSAFKRKMLALYALRGLLLDRNDSNVVFLLDNVEWLPHSEARFQEARHAEFEKIIIEEWAFPSAAIIVPKAVATSSSHYVNGHRRLGNGQFWPLNLQVSLESVCKREGDPLGQAILKNIFRYSDEVPHENLLFTNINLVAADDSKVFQYRELVPTLNSPPIWRISGNALSRRRNKFAELKAERKEETTTGVPEMENSNKPCEELEEKYRNLEAKYEMLKAELAEERAMRIESSRQANKTVGKLLATIEELEDEKRARLEDAQEANKTDCKPAKNENEEKATLEDPQKGTKTFGELLTVSDEDNGSLEAAQKANKTAVEPQSVTGKENLVEQMDLKKVYELLAVLKNNIDEEKRERQENFKKAQEALSELEATIKILMAKVNDVGGTESLRESKNKNAEIVAQLEVRITANREDLEKLRKEFLAELEKVKMGALEHSEKNKAEILTELSGEKSKRMEDLEKLRVEIWNELKQRLEAAFLIR